ncbi:MAG: hypothetical protein IIA61_10440 [Candidatus Marinimicrobia bacterium]|nr:hypothetical protein [Candidatus Neomarinimicrobiota bacterium]
MACSELNSVSRHRLKISPTYPVDGDTIDGISVAIQGSSTDGTGSGVDSVFITTDDGQNWSLSEKVDESYDNWTFLWENLNYGDYVIRSRAKDVEENLEMPGDSIRIHVKNSLPFIVNPLLDFVLIEDGPDTSLLPLDSVFSDLNMGDTLIYNAVVDPENSLVVTIDNLTNIPIIHLVSNWNGSASVVFSATDDPGATISDTISVTVLSVNDIPVISDIPDMSFPEDDSLSFDLDDYVDDVDDHDSTLTWDVFLMEGEGFLLTASHHNRRLEKSYRVENKYLSKSFDQVKFSKNTVNDELVMNAFRSSRVNSIGGMIKNEEDSITVVIDPATRIVTFTATENYFVENVHFVFTVTDDSGATDADTMNITVNPINDPPVLFQIPDIIFTEDESLVFYYSGWFEYVEDVDDPDSTLNWGIIENDQTDFTFYPSYIVITSLQNWYGADIVSVVAMDPGGLSDTTEIVITVTSVNDLPVISNFPDSVIFRADSSVILDLNEYVSDVDGPDSTLQWSVSGNDSVIVSINDTTNVALLSSPLSWSGYETLIFNCHR